MEKKIRRITVKFYSGNHYLPSYDKTFEYDLNDDESFNKAWTAAAYKIYEVSEANGEEIKARIVKEEY